MMKQINCGSYTVDFGQVNDLLSNWLKEKSYSKIFFLVDKNTERFCLPLIQLSVTHDSTIIVIPDGEISKNLNSCQMVWKEMVQKGADRYSLLINLGGGVVGDLGGFCASVYQRGIDFIHIPTSLLAQADASVGGKVGVDFLQLKNYLGSFTNPEKVIIDVHFLKTLPKIHFQNGLAEIFKHALIRSKSIWKGLRNGVDFNEDEIEDILHDSISIKQSIVARDFKENGLRKVLNFGHTVGHAIESRFMHSSKPVLHGFAIVAGMICESHISFQRKLLSKPEMQEISSILIDLYGTIDLTPSDIEEIMIFLGKDKKNKEGEINFSLLDGIGNCNYDQSVNIREVKESLFYYQMLGQGRG